MEGRDDSTVGYESKRQAYGNYMGKVLNAMEKEKDKNPGQAFEIEERYSRNTEPILLRLRILSKIRIKGVFSACLKSLTVFRISSSFFNLRITFDKKQKYNLLKFYCYLHLCFSKKQ